jgi:hypothetical protein
MFVTDKRACSCPGVDFVGHSVLHGKLIPKARYRRWIEG